MFFVERILDFNTSLGKIIQQMEASQNQFKPHNSILKEENVTASVKPTCTQGNTEKLEDWPAPQTTCMP